MQGTYRRDQDYKLINLDKMTEVPEAPGYMLGESAKHFTLICRTLLAMGTLTNVDMLMVAQLADSISLYNLAYEKIHNDALIQETGTGYTQIHAWYTVFTRERKMIFDLSAKFGLTPYDRDRIKMKETTDISGDMDGFLKRPKALNE